MLAALSLVLGSLDTLACLHPSTPASMSLSPDPGPNPAGYRALSPLSVLRHGSARERSLILGTWALLTAACVGLGLLSVMQHWSGLPLNFGGMTVYLTLYPPLPICLLLTLCWGWWWGAVPAWLATLCLALYGGMTLPWAALFACTIPLGLAVMAIGYQAIPLRRDLRDAASLLFFLQLCFVAAVFSSSGALIWCYLGVLDQSGVLATWQGWWLGAFLQSVLIAGPLLAWAWPAVQRWQQRHARLLREATGHARRRVLRLLAAALAGVLMFGYATAQLASTAMPPAHVLQQMLWVSFWVFTVIILFAAFLSFQLYVHWQRSSDQLLSELQQANWALEQLAHTDALTGLLNRRAVDERLQSEWSRLQRTPGRAAVLLLDIDHFKRINDQHGHPAGDAVIRRVAEVINIIARGMDVAARYGGEEFLILLPHTDAQGAYIVAERLRERIAADTMAHEGLALSAQVSLGVAELRAEDRSHLDWLARADRALYQAKQTGRNRTVMDAGTPGTPTPHEIGVSGP